jgi:hypothetical protein
MPSRQTTDPLPWKSKTGILVLAISYVFYIPIPALSTIQAFIALISG